MPARPEVNLVERWEEWALAESRAVTETGESFTLTFHADILFRLTDNLSVGATARGGHWLRGS